MFGLKLQCEKVRPPNDLGDGNSRQSNSKGSIGSTKENHPGWRLAGQGQASVLW